MITAKQYRVAAQHLKQAQESLRLARHALGGDEEEDYYKHDGDGYAVSTPEAIRTTFESVGRITAHCGVVGVERVSP